MASLFDDLSSGIKALGSEWTKYTAVGTFLLYVAGYLSLRFHLLVLGIATDLSILDERYVFAGARFVVYLMSALPSIIVMAAPLAFLGWLAGRVLPTRMRLVIAQRLWRPGVLLAIGIVVSVVAIQGLLRQSYVLQDLLLASRLPRHPSWLVDLLLVPSSTPVYFNLLVALCLAPLVMLRLLYGQENVSTAVATGRPVLALLVAIQLLFLPINFGVLIIDKSLARVTAAGDRTSLPGDFVWLAWEGKSAITFLVCSADGQRRSLIVQPREKVASIEVVGSDFIFPALFSRTGERLVSPQLAKP
jgi:hypothetical protein